MIPRALLLLLGACAAPSVMLDGVAADAKSHLRYDVLRMVEEGDTIWVQRASWGNAVALGPGLYVTPRHVFPRGTIQLGLSHVPITSVSEVCAGADEYRPRDFADVRHDWVVFRVFGPTSPPTPRIPTRVTVGDIAHVLPDGGPVRVAAVDLPGGLLATELGAAERGWSGRPVEVGGVVIGFAQGVTSDGQHLVVVPLPCLPVEAHEEHGQWSATCVGTACRATGRKGIPGSRSFTIRGRWGCATRSR